MQGEEVNFTCRLASSLVLSALRSSQTEKERGSAAQRRRRLKMGGAKEGSGWPSWSASRGDGAGVGDFVRFV